MRRRKRRRSGRLSANTSVPSNVTLPAVASSSRNTRRPTVVLPEPLSPTSPSTAPFGIEKLTPSTARTCCTTRPSTPPRIGKCFTRPFTRTSGTLMPVSPRPGPGGASARSGRRDPAWPRRAPPGQRGSPRRRARTDSRSGSRAGGRSTSVPVRGWTAAVGRASPGRGAARRPAAPPCRACAGVRRSRRPGLLPPPGRPTSPPPAWRTAPRGRGRA